MARIYTFAVTERAPRIGVLALQGAFREHAAVLRGLGAAVVEVRLPRELDGLDGLVIPGGESTTMMRLARLYALDDAIRSFPGAVLGTCAGMIVLDRRHLDLVDLEVDRNAYGRQVASFEADVELAWDGTPLHGVFIRAPRVTSLGDGVEVLGELEGEPVLVRDGRYLLASFHPELTGDTRVHELFLESCGRALVSGHSKWSSIKHKKGAADAKRGKLFSKLSRAIMVAAKEGGPDPAANLALQNAIEKARSYSMPKDNIERAVAKGSGEGADGAAFEAVVYEGYGPEGVAVLVEALTDNRNRTASEVRHQFSKHGGNLGASGAVAWQFERLGVVLVPAEGIDEEAILLVAADAGADDVELDGPVFQVSSAPEQLATVRQALEDAGFAIESAELSMVPKTTVAISDETVAKRVVRLVEGLEESDDVQDVYANFDIPEAVLDAVAS